MLIDMDCEDYPQMLRSFSQPAHSLWKVHSLPFESILKAPAVCHCRFNTGPLRSPSVSCSSLDLNHQYRHQRTMGHAPVYDE